MREFFLAVLIAVVVHCSGCSADTSGLRPNAYWRQRPVTVYVNEEMSQPCLDSVEEALLFWGQFVDYLNPEYVTAVQPQILGIDKAGTIAFTAGLLSDNVAGETYYLMTESGEMHSAHITLALCTPSVAAHELGHALGLRDVDDTTNLMNWYNAEGWGLTDEQLESVK